MCSTDTISRQFEGLQNCGKRNNFRRCGSWCNELYALAGQNKLALRATVALMPTAGVGGSFYLENLNAKVKVLWVVVIDGW